MKDIYALSDVQIHKKIGDCRYDQPPTVAYSKDVQSVTSNQVYAVICRSPDTFVKAEGRIYKRQFC